jgi:hypothetical protein
LRSSSSMMRVVRMHIIVSLHAYHGQDDLILSFPFSLFPFPLR